MYCVVQEIQLKKPAAGGECREYEVQTTSITVGGQTKTYYSYYPNHEAGRFERPHREAYKISVHVSRRENGKVKKKQYPIGTVGYYALIEWGLYDYIDRGVAKAAQAMGLDYQEVYKPVEDKMEPIRQRVEREYQTTEEYKVVTRRRKIQATYQKAKAAFAKKYGVDEREYDVCYNVFGEVMNQPYLDQIIESFRAYRSYYDSSGSNYDWGGAGSYRAIESSTYSEAEKATLKRFYKTLAMKFHPDTGGTEEDMKLLNNLKDEWGI